MARWALISGPKGSPKAEHAEALARWLRAAGVQVGGFYQRGYVDAEGLKRQEIVHVTSLRRATVAAEVRRPEPGQELTACSLAFDANGFDEARRWLQADLDGGAQVLFVGDLSKSEVVGQGHASSARMALAAPEECIAVLLVRADQLFWVVERFELGEDELLAALELPISEGEAETFRRVLLEAALSAGSRSPGAVATSGSPSPDRPLERKEGEGE